MWRVSQAEGVSPNANRVPLSEFEFTTHTKIQAEVSGPPKLIAVSVSVMSICVAGNQRCGKGARVEELAAGLDAGLSAARWLPIGPAINADLIGRLRRTVRVQVAAGGHGKRTTGKVANEWIDQPAAQKPATYTRLRPALSLPKRKSHHTEDLKVVGTVKTCNSAILFPEVWIWKGKRAEFFIIGVVDRLRPGPDEAGLRCAEPLRDFGL